MWHPPFAAARGRGADGSQYYIGVVDLLQTYTTTKAVESWAKGLILDGTESDLCECDKREEVG